MKLSVVIVTWNNENYIEKAIKSCICSSFTTEYEVLVVYNASSDKTREMIYRTIKGHENLFTVIENDENLGLGEARNMGIRHAVGEYIIFLDGDDWYEQDAILKIIEVIKNKKPDLLIFNYVKYHPDGYLEQSPTTWLLENKWRRTPSDRALLMKNFGVAWNKAYKKSIINDMGFSFPNITYEDIVWNASWISLTENIYVIPDNLIYYRQRTGSILRSTGKQHFDTLIQ
ncbi:glycosyltransferase family 2 protein, partial [Paenochrobactrum sp. BZR 588]|uniref:glycosyltransferase family 2 protein n=1 Tax=unclassified Paenochrobactrum TaxID=2639760 RepID=UPI0038528A03